MAHHTFSDMKSVFVSRLVESEPDTHANLMSLASEHRIEDMFSMMWNLDLAHECLTPPELPVSGKCEAEATQKHDEGKRYYEEEKFDKALQCYNEGIMCAPHPPLKEDYESGASHDSPQTLDTVTKQPEERSNCEYANELLICEDLSDVDSKTISSSEDSSEDFEHVQVKGEFSSSEDDFERLSNDDVLCGDNDSSVNSSEEELTEEGFALVKPEKSDEKCVVG